MKDTESDVEHKPDPCVGEQTALHGQVQNFRFSKKIEALVAEPVAVITTFSACISGYDFTHLPSVESLMKL